MDTDDENDSDDNNRCCSDPSDDNVSSDDDDDEIDLNDLQTANAGSVTNESSGPRHKNSVAVVVKSLPLTQSPARPNDLSLTASVNQPMTKGDML